MTNGEKMIWATAFVRSFGERTDHPPSALEEGPVLTLALWRQKHAAGAAKDAMDVLRAAREVQTMDVDDDDEAGEAFLEVMQED